MAEAMTVESIIDAYWQTLGYWTRVRFPYFVSTQKGGKNSGGWSDVDVLAFNPRDKKSEKSVLVLGESKAHGPKDAIKTVNSLIKDSSKFREAIPVAILGCSELNHIIFEELYIHIVGNIHVNDEFKIVYENGKYLFEDGKDSSENRELLTEIKTNFNNKPLPDKITLHIESLFSVFSKIIGNLNESDEKIGDSGDEEKVFGKRFGSPILDIAREFNRYLGGSKYKNESKKYSHVLNFYEVFFKNLGIDILKLCKYYYENNSKDEKLAESLDNQIRDWFSDEKKSKSKLYQIMKDIG